MFKTNGLFGTYRMHSNKTGTIKMKIRYLAVVIHREIRKHSADITIQGFRMRQLPVPVGQIIGQ